MDNDSEDRGFGEVEEREDGDEAEETAEETEEDEQAEDEQNESENDDSEEADDQQDDEETEEDDDEDESDGKRTEKGTKLDENPKSAVHQQLANEKKVRGQMEQVLANPQLLARFMKAQYGIDVPVGDAKDKTEDKTEQTTTTTVAGKKFSAKDFENIEDVANVVNELQDSFAQQLKTRDSEIKELKEQLGGISKSSSIARIADNMQSDVTSLRSVAELDPKNPDFIPGLEEEIGALYHQLDFNEKTGAYEGKYSIKQVGNYIVNAARTARKAGSLKAQTIVRDKTGGKVRTGASRSTGQSRDDLAPADSIAKGIARMFKN